MTIKNTGIRAYINTSFCIVTYKITHFVLDVEDKICYDSTRAITHGCHHSGTISLRIG